MVKLKGSWPDFKYNGDASKIFFIGGRGGGGAVDQRLGDARLKD